jgi:hypothetical protein
MSFIFDDNKDGLLNFVQEEEVDLDCKYEVSYHTLPLTHSSFCQKGQTILTLAILNQALDLAKIFIELGCDVNAQDNVLSLPLCC